MYDLHRLRLLRELSHRRTLAAVAEALGYSPSAISHQLGILERETGVTLLEPAGRGVRLTPAADMLVARTENIMLELERAEADVAASQTGIAGTLRIATFQTAARTIVLEAITNLAAEHPHLVVTFTHIDAGAAIPALIARDFDLVLSETFPGNPAPPRPGVTTVEIARDPLLLAIPASWPEHDLTQLAERPWVLEPAGSAARFWATAVCRDAGFEPIVRYETADITLHADVITRELATGFLPQLALTPTPELRLTPTGHSRSIWLSTRTGAEASPALTALRHAVVNASTPSGDAR